MAVRRPHRALVVLAADPDTNDGAARALAASLDDLGIETEFLGHEESARRVATAAIDRRADSVELCLASRASAVLLLRELFRELTQLGRRDVTIVVHRLDTTR